MRVSTNTDIWMVMWRDPAIWEQPGISNIYYVDLLAPILSKVNVRVLTSSYEYIKSFMIQSQYYSRLSLFQENTAADSA